MFILYLVNPINFLNIRKVDLWEKKSINMKLEVGLLIICRTQTTERHAWWW